MAERFVIRGVSDIEEIEKVPLGKRVSVTNVYDCILQGAQRNPAATAISFIMDGNQYDRPIQITYQALMHKIRQAANMFHDLGVGPKDVVTYVLPNVPQTYYTLWAAETAGIANPINPMLDAQTIKEICQTAGTQVLVTLGKLPGTDIWEKIDSIRKDIPSLKYVLRVMGPTEEAEKIYSFDEKIETYPGDKLTFDRKIDKDDIASVYHTGGTTGRPKLARRTHYNEVVVAWDIMASSGLQPGEAVMIGLPLFHCNGTMATGLMPFSVGGQVVMLSPQGYRNPAIMKNFYKIVEHYKPVFFSCVPTILSVLLDMPVGDADISSLRYVVCGAAPLSVELFNRFEKHTGMKILEGYGLTESAVASVINPKDGERKIGSIGIRLPYQQVKIVILDENGKYVRDAGVNEIGAVAINGPCVFKGYMEEAHNKDIWLPGGWFNTGDLGRQDKDGYFFLTGRKKELIIRGGHNIDPATIEESIYKLDGVKTVAAVGRPDAHAGEVPMAYVEISETSGLNVDKILNWARDNIGERAAVPKEIVIIDKIPLTPVGKIFKPALKWDAARRIYEKELQALGDLVVSLEVSVGEHKLHGSSAVIQVKPAAGVDPERIKKRISELLTMYTVHYEVVVK
jgi:fatty-acyl-CoA synthase